ncbi:hypothetical protein RRG08_030648 [Elysia crispata]|uniref:Uncharacterized protein n=1 Tax=Elysia crispata TaxID=231223 RepID=A0AAE0YR23_9GAST|nr:hypothetical protein RRG08_030648 [Elysia crispata]
MDSQKKRDYSDITLYLAEISQYGVIQIVEKMYGSEELQNINECLVLNWTKLAMSWSRVRDHSPAKSWTLARTKPEVEQHNLQTVDRRD